MVIYKTKEEIRPRCRTLHAISGSKFGDYVKTLSREETHKDTPCLLVSIE